jgi:hypothetical protein
MVLLLAVIALFLFGVIALTGRGLSSVQPSKGDAEMNREAKRILDRVQALVVGAEVFLAGPGAPPADNVQLLFVADLDGSGGKLEVNQGGSGFVSKGLETVDILRSDGSSRREGIPAGRFLVARVQGDSGKTSQNTLTSMLDPADPQAFRVEYRGEDGQSVDLAAAARSASLISAVRVSVRLRSRGESRRFTRLIRLEAPARAVQAQIRP